MKYIIMADNANLQPFDLPRQLTKINGEPLIKRTVRLLKENGVEDIWITSHDKRFDNLGAKRYEPLNNYYDRVAKKGYWLNAFPTELLNQPITFLWGDVYYSENAIKTIVETKAKDNLFFCTYQNKDKRYIKCHDEPLAYKVVDCESFKKHIDIVKKMFDEGKTVRHPISWELYRSINGQDINVHTMTTNYVAINDESCDIDTINDIILLKEKLGGKNMVRCETIREFTLERFNELKNIKRRKQKEDGRLFVGDEFECNEELAEYLTGNNAKNQIVVKVLEIIPEKKKVVKVTKTTNKNNKKKTKKGE